MPPSKRSKRSQSDLHGITPFLSTAIDGRRIFTGLLIGIPMAAATYGAAQAVTDYAIQEIRSRLDTQRDALAHSIQQSELQQKREIDQIRDDIRELRQMHNNKPGGRNN